jgi:hypothetical protein
MNDDNPGRRGATKIDPGTAHHSGRSPEKLCLRHLAARANPCSGPFGLAWRAGTEQGRLRKSASGESRLQMKMVADQIPKLIDDPQRVLEQVALEPVELEG